MTRVGYYAPLKTRPEGPLDEMTSSVTARATGKSTRGALLRAAGPSQEHLIRMREHVTGKGTRNIRKNLPDTAIRFQAAGIIAQTTEQRLVSSPRHRLCSVAAPP